MRRHPGQLLAEPEMSVARATLAPERSAAEQPGPLPGVQRPTPQLALHDAPTRSRLAEVFTVMGGGLLVQALGDTAGHSRHSALAQFLFLLGAAVIFGAGAWRLVGGRAGDRERLQVAALLGLMLLVSSRLFNPILFTGFDELLHQTTLWQLQHSHWLFTRNTVLPVSPFYPGLELLTIGVRDVTGVSDVVAELLVVALARLLLVLALFRIAGRLLGSARAAGIAVLVYAASPQFYSFNAAYSYQTLALAFGAGAVCLLLAALDGPRPQRDHRLLLVDLSLLALVATHHLVAAITVAGLIAWALVARVRGDRSSARVVGHAAVVGGALFAAWTAMAWSVVAPYLKPILVGAVDGLGSLVAHFGSHRALLQSQSDIANPFWQQALVVVSVLVFLVLLAVVTVAAWRRRRGRVARYGTLAVLVAYAVDLASALSSDSSEVGQRASTFVFFAIAAVLGWFLRLAMRRGRDHFAMAALLTVAFAGSVVLGAGPIWDDVPGPYVPTAEPRAVDNPTIEAARWAAVHLPVNATIAADRDNGATMAAIGHLAPVTAFSGGVNVGPLYFDKIFGNYDLSLTHRAHIDYVLVDRRLLEGPPAFGSYFEPGETQGPERLTKAQLTKFAAVPGFAVVYQNGPITIYSLAGLGEKAAPATPVARDAGNAGGLALLAAALALCLRRRGGGWLGADGPVELLLAGCALLIALGFLVVVTGVSPLPVEVAAAVVAVGGAAAACIRPGPRRRLPLPSLRSILYLTGAAATAVALTICALGAPSGAAPAPVPAAAPMIPAPGTTGAGGTAATGASGTAATGAAGAVAP